MTAEMLKGHLDNILLAILSSAPAHGYAVIEQLRRRSSGRFDLPEGTVYPALHRLELMGLIESNWVTPEGGRRRRVYALTPSGRQALSDRRGSWRSFAQAVSAVLDEDPQWQG
jgi:DNA-binding PadR family transcriptional regulator